MREWLDANAASGYLEVADGAYRLPPEQAMALANPDSPVFVAPGQSVVASCFMDLDKVLQAFRGNGAFPWGAHHHRMFHGVEQFFRPGYQANLATAWLPALDGVVDKLRHDAKVADVGCGHGDCLHDMGDPVGAARHARQALKDDGTVLLALRPPLALSALRAAV